MPRNINSKKVINENCVIENEESVLINTLRIFFDTFKEIEAAKEKK